MATPSNEELERDRFSQVIVRMPVDMHEEIKRRAEQEDRTMAQTIRRAVKAYLAGPAVA